MPDRTFTTQLQTIFATIYMLKIFIRNTEKKVYPASTAPANTKDTTSPSASQEAIKNEFKAYVAAIDRLEALYELYDSLCENAQLMIDTIEDRTVAEGLSLHYINGLEWHQVREHTGVVDIHSRCKYYFSHNGGENSVI